MICLFCCLMMMQTITLEAQAASITGNTDMGISLGRNIDIAKKGSIQIKEKYGQGIQYHLYQIGEFDADGSAYYTETFALYRNEFSVTFDTIESAEDAGALAQNISQLVDLHSILANASGTTNAAGTVTFNNLTPGLYYVCAESFTTEDGKTYSATPVIISLPGSDGAENYNIVIESKSEQTTPSEVPPTDNEPGTDTPKSNRPTGKLPQTGVLWWPVPVLLIGGLALYLLGYMIEIRKNKQESKNR